MRRMLFFAVCLIVVSSCKDCKRYASGYVVDRETKKPIAHATVRSYAALDDRKRDERITYTDTTGWFETAFELDGVAKCGILKLIVTDSNYHNGYEAELPHDDTIFLERKKKK